MFNKNIKKTNKYGIQTTQEYDFTKIGLNEVKGLEEVLRELVASIEAHLKDNIYWNECKFDQAEYQSRDGFIAHSHNHGGLELGVVIPKCEEYDFEFLEFGECDSDECDHDHSCDYEDEGHLDAYLRIFFKFEGFCETTGKMKFYLELSGGNGDAPYFRTKYLADIFSIEFEAKDFKELRTKGKIVVNKLLKVMRGK